MNLSVLASTSNRTVDPKVVALDSVEIPSAAGGVNRVNVANRHLNFF